MKKLLLIAISLIIGGCDESTPVLDKNDSGRIQVKSATYLNGYTLNVLYDTKTGREYLLYGAGALVEIKPKGE